MAGTLKGPALQACSQRQGERPAHPFHPASPPSRTRQPHPTLPSPKRPPLSQISQWLATLQKSSKVLADAMEALLGAFLVAGGHSAALAFLQAKRPQRGMC